MLIYQYNKCGTCRKAMKWLKDNGIEGQVFDITTEPPSEEQLREFITKSGLEIKKFFNTSGQKYKELNLKDRLPQMSDDEKIKLLASDGRLIKRPIIVDGDKITVGFNEEQFEQTWGNS